MNGIEAPGHESENPPLMHFGVNKKEHSQMARNYIKLQGEQEIPVIVIWLFSVCHSGPIPTHWRTHFSFPFTVECYHSQTLTQNTTCPLPHAPGLIPLSIHCQNDQAA